MEKAKTDEKQSSAAATQHQVPSISLPKGGGALRAIDEKFSVNAANGTCNLTIPLPFSKARSALGCNIDLNYNSGSGNSGFGLGWALNLPSIQRRTDKQLPTYEDANDGDVFVFAGADDLVPAYVLDSSGNWVADAPPPTPGIQVERYRPRMEGPFARIEKVSVQGEIGAYWKVTSRENVTTIFGRTAAARITNPQDPGRIFRWLPEWAYDDQGNCVEYLYKDEDLVNVPDLVEEKNRHSLLARFSNKHLKRVRYGNSKPYYPDSSKPYNPPAPTSPDYFFDVVFDYGEHDDLAPTPGEPRTWPCRFDPFSDYRAGFEVRTYRLCRRILFFHTFNELAFSPAPYLVRSLDLSYAKFHFDGAPYQSEEADFVTVVKRVHYKKTGPAAYDRKSWPALEFTYQPFNWNKAVQNVSSENLIGAPGGVSGPYHWLDLYGEGIPGILTEQATGWYYKSNLGDGNFSRMLEVAAKPSMRGVSSGSLQFLDLAADGSKQLVSTIHHPRGYFELDDENNWLPFREFVQLANIDFPDPNTKLLDLNGDGAPDLLVSEEHAFRWYPSLGRLGYDAAEITPKPYDEEVGPAVLFGDGTQTIMTADMNGDGLVDIVRVRNGEVCYWPNLGYGRFGAKVTMRNAPLFDRPEHFDPMMIQFGDISGTGAADLIYLGRGGFSAWINLAGNAWSDPQSIDPFPGTEAPNRVSVVDLLGNGTVCLVWSSELPANTYAPLRYVDLMGGKKPNIVNGYRNGLGSQVTLEYKSSTHYALLDKQDGRPWATKLPFPTMCVSRVQTDDAMSGATYVRQYRYRHGYYDHAEREFRGFGMVEETDSESFEKFQKSGASNVVDASVFQAPVLTRTWFHTGAFINGVNILQQFSLDYYQGETTPEHVLPDAVIDAPSTSPEELRQAARACKGMMLRQEVYADDDSPEANIPYSTASHNCYIRMLQPQLDNRYAVFLTHESEAITYHYERNPDDPRIIHELNTVVDEFGNVIESASLAYARLKPDTTLPAEIQAEQGRIRATYTVNSFTNDVLSPPAYRPRLACETQVFELTGANALHTWFTPQEIWTEFHSASPLEFEQPPHNGMLEKRLIRDHRTLYAKDANPNLPLPLGVLQPLGLTYESYGLALTPSLLSALYGSRVTNAMLSEGAYVNGDNYVASGWFPSSDVAGRWWSRVGTVQYPANPEQHFYLPTQYTDAFGNPSQVRYYSTYHLLIDRVTDPLGNQTTVDAFDFRLLAPVRSTDINNNVTEVSIDIFGLVVGLAIEGKAAEADNLTGFQPDLTQAQINSFLADPVTNGATLLGNATSRFVYNFATLPAVSASITRETHAQVAIASGTPSKLQYSFEYSDGLGHIALKKAQTEPGPANQCVVNADGTYTITTVDTTPKLRWIGTGRNVLNNKGSPVMQYEPYFSVTPAYEDAKQLVESGVTPVFFYDPVSRLVRTDFPDGSFSSIEFDTWLQKTFDRNDHVVVSAWYVARIGGALGTAEKTAAEKAAVHDDTPSSVSFDTLGRPIYAVEDNKYVDRITSLMREDFYGTVFTLDIDGNRLSVRDPRDNYIMRFAYDMLGRPCATTSMDAGQRYVLTDTASQPLYGWDAKGNRLHSQYDVLRRPVQHEVLTAANATIVFEKSVYGTNPATNQNGRLAVQYDRSGVVTNDVYDFKGNLLSTTRTFTSVYIGDIDWSNPAAIPLEPSTYTTQATYDALNRVLANSTPDGSVITSGYTESGLLGTVSAAIRGGATQPFVTRITHDEKLRRQTVDFANGVLTTFTYDTLTFRIRRILTVRSADNTTLQDLNYTYDPIGNVTQIRDSAQQSIYFNNQKIEPQTDFVYDSIYRLLSATGREHIGQNAPVSQFDEFRTNLAQPGDGTAMQRYLQQYDYDRAGNLLNMVHSSGSGPFVNQWTRQLTPAAGNNRLASSQIGATPESYSYDVHGNLTTIPGMPTLNWDFDDHLRSIDLGGGGIAYYTYDAKGNRVRKVIERQGGIVDQRLYVGPVEFFTSVQGATPKLTRETLHVMDGGSRLAMVDSLLFGKGAPGVLIRYQFSNHLESATLELDGGGQIISYEEYYPYGSTSFQSVDASREVPAKRYRYTAKERDEESGLEYHGARYYAPWIARWTACDPKSIAAGPNLYQYVSANPVKMVDPTGTNGEVAQIVLNRKEGIAAAEALYDKLINKGQFAVQELTALAGKGGSRLDIVTKTRSIESKLINLEKYIQGGELNVSKINRTLTRYFAQVAKHQQAIEGRGFLNIGMTEKTGTITKLEETLVFSVKNSGGKAEEFRDLVRGIAGAKVDGIRVGPKIGVIDLAKAAEAEKGVAAAEQAVAATAKVASKAETALVAVGKVSKAVAPVAKVLKPLAPVAKVAGRVAGPLALGVSVAQLATAKTTDEKIDAGISTASNALLMSKNPVAMAAGGGLAAGQFLEKNLNVSEFSSQHGLDAQQFALQHGAGETTALVTGAVVTVVSTPVALGEAAAAKVASWFH